MTLALIALAIAMATGTFVEDHYDTQVARDLIYNTYWFEGLFILLGINFWGHVQKYHMLSTRKLSGFVFHLAFLIMIIGAGITRYFGFEGQMHIREGDASSALYSSETYLGLGIGDSVTTSYKIHFNQFSGEHFKANLTGSKGEKIELKTKTYLANAVENFEDNNANGQDMLEVYLAGMNGRERIVVPFGGSKQIGKSWITFSNEKSGSGIQVQKMNGELKITPPETIIRTIMAERRSDTLHKDSAAVFKEMCLYQMGETTIMFKKFHPKAIKKIEASQTKEGSSEAVLMGLKVNDKEFELPIMFEAGQIMDPRTFVFNGVKLSIGYGRKEIELPFSLYLRKFILERYAGSESPSSYASEVTLIDPKNDKKFEHRIFMNNVLDYQGYRFFQSSYDRDEKGTVLSVNHDFWGTWVSYLGYSLLALGFILTLLNKYSRFLALRKGIAKVRQDRRNLANGAIGLVAFVCMMLGSTGLFAADDAMAQGKGEAQGQGQGQQKIVPLAIAEQFGHLITQTVDGRFEPVNTLAYDALHKISRKHHFKLDGIGEVDAMQAFMDMMVHPEYWKQQKIVYIKEQSVRDVLGIQTKEAAFIDFFDEKMNYKLQEYAEKAFRKKPIEQNTFDKEIIKLDERANVFMMIFEGSLLKVFPDGYTSNHKWISWDDKDAQIILPEQIKQLSPNLQYPQLSYNLILRAFFSSMIDGMNAGDFTSASKIIDGISAIQKGSPDAILLPSETKVNGEIFYNKANIFVFLRNYYSVLSLVLLILAFIENIQQKPARWVKVLLNIGVVFLALGFAYQTFGMVLRAYLLGYAPWSNGYEALLLVAWGTLLAGFSFARYSKITLAATSLLAYFVLMTASHSSYDPQMTSLTPVLKSYWLIIHVAVLTISYGFLGLGFVLGLINLFIYLFKNEENERRLSLLTTELTFINEMNLTIGLALATIGTFLGGVWASESWGRYWGWDAKETWALIIVITYTLLLHLRFIPKLSGKLFFNVCSVLGFSSVLMTFFGVNYFLSKGMHSYGAGDHAIFPIWAWICIGAIFLLIFLAKRKANSLKQKE